MSTHRCVRGSQRLCARPTTWAEAACLALCLVLPGPAAMAQSSSTQAQQTIEFSIDAQPLAQALAELARQARLRLALAPELAQGRTAPALRGGRSVQEALAELLRGSGLAARVDSGAIVVERVAASQSAQQVIVTGTKRGNTQQQTAESVAVLSGEQLEERGITSVSDALDRVPNLVKGGFGVQIRGFNTSTADDQIRRPSIAFVRDGVESEIIGFSTLDSLWDLDQIEVLRGSQSTAYGRSAIGGAIVQNTRNPTFMPEYGGRLGFGNDNFRVASAVASGPLSSELAYRFAIDHQRRDTAIPGFFFGPVRSAQTVGRGKLLWKPRGVSGLELLGTIEVIDGDLVRENNAITHPFTLDNPFFVDTSRAKGGAFGDSRLTNASLKLKADVAERWKLEVTAGGYRRRQQTRTDRILCIDATDPLNPVPRDEAECLRFDNDFSGHNVTQEARLIHQRGAWGATVGAFNQRQVTTFRYFDTSFDGSTRLFDGENNFRVKSQALFGEVTYDFSPAWRLTTAARYNRETSSTDGFDYFTGAATTGYRQRSSKLTPELSLRHVASPALTLHASLRRGFRAGGAELAEGVTDLDDRDNTRVRRVIPFDPETNDTAEVGLRWQDAVARLTVNANVYLSHYKDRQVGISARDENGNIIYVTDPSFPDFFYEAGATVNAARSRSSGLEIEANWRALPSLNLYAGLGVQRGKYTDFPQEDGSNLAGQRFEDFPKLTGNAGVVYRFGSGWSAAIDVNHIGSAEGDGVRTPSRTLLGARVGYDGEQWSVGLSANNLLDKRYLLSRFGEEAVPGTQSNYGAFRTWRLEARLTF
jgi:iron complex outermembrane recepter protein